MIQAIIATGRPMLYSISPGVQANPSMASLTYGLVTCTESQVMIGTHGMICAPILMLQGVVTFSIFKQFLSSLKEKNCLHSVMEPPGAHETFERLVPFKMSMKYSPTKTFYVLLGTLLLQAS